MKLLDCINTDKLLGESVFLISNAQENGYISFFPTFCFKLLNGDVLQTNMNVFLPVLGRIDLINSRLIDLITGKVNVNINYDRWVK